MACTGGLHDPQRIGRVLSKCLPQALALRGIGQRAHHESVQAHAHLLGIFFKLQLERAGQFQAGGDAGRNSGHDKLHSRVVRSDYQGEFCTASDSANDSQALTAKSCHLLNEYKRLYVLV
jgi:hypothetical protein